MELQTLQQVFPDWPENAPSDASELSFCDDAELEARGLQGEDLEKVRQLRAHIRRATNSWGATPPLGTPGQVEDAIARGEIRLLSKRWLALALDSKKRRTFVQFSADSSRAIGKVTRIVPEPEWLPGLPNNGSYLLLWGGGPDVLEIDDVRDRLLALASVPLVDVLFRKLETGPKSTLYSLRQGFGVCNRKKIEFPTQHHTIAQSMWRKGTE